MFIATCDDEVRYCEQIELFAHRLGEQLNISFQCDKYTSGRDLLKSDVNKYQIIFLDIKMIDENGIKIAEKIRQTNQKVEIVFLTALLKYAVEGYKVRAYRFLVKPLEYEEFVFQLKELMLKLWLYEKNIMEIFWQGQPYHLKVNDIIYVEVINHELTYHLLNRNIRTEGTMKKVEHILSNINFVRLHNSYLVNMKYICEVKYQYVVMINGDEIPISRGKKERFRQVYLEFWGGELG